MKGDSLNGHCQKKVRTTELKFPGGSCIQSNENPSVRWGGGIDDFCNSTVAKLILILVVQYTLTKKMNRQFNIGVPFGTLSLNGHTIRFHKCMYNKNTFSSVESRLLGAHGALAWR